MIAFLHLVKENKEAKMDNAIPNAQPNSDRSARATRRATARQTGSPQTTSPPSFQVSPEELFARLGAMMIERDKWHERADSLEQEVAALKEHIAALTVPTPGYAEADGPDERLVPKGG